MPAGLSQSLAAETGIGQYGTSLFDPVAQMTNWASSLATGGQAGGNIPSFESSATQAGPGILFGGKGTEWASSFDPTTGLITFTNPHKAGQTFVSTLEQAKNEGADIPQGVLDNWTQSRDEFLSGRGSVRGGAATGSTAPQVQATATPPPAGLSIPDFQAWIGQNVGKTVFIGGKQVTISDSTAKQVIDAAQTGSLQFQGPGQASLGPQLQAAWDQIQKIPGLEAVTSAFESDQESKANQLFGEGETLFGQGQTLFGQGEQMLSDATTGSGLFPSQQALVNQAVQSEQNKIAAQLGAEGLTSSTAKEELQGQAALSGAATAGQLIQENIAAAQKQIGLAQTQESAAQNQINLSQTASKLALGAQELTLGEQTAMASAAAGLQKQLWDEAMSGYGVLGGMIKEVASTYGIDVQGYADILAADTQLQGIQASVQESQNQQSNSSMGMLGQGLGMLFGQGGGGGGGGLGGLFSSIGGVFGGGAAAAGGIGAGIGSAAAGTDVAGLAAGLVGLAGF